MGILNIHDYDLKSLINRIRLKYYKYRKRRKQISMIDFSKIDKNKCTVLFFRKLVIHKTENFVYNEITSIKNFNKILLTKDENSILHYKNIPKIIIPNDLIPNLSQVLNSNNVKLLHAQFGTDALLLLDLKKKTGLPLITSFRGFDASMYPKLHPNCYEELFEVGDLFLVRSNHMKNDLIKLGCYQKKIKIHHTGINIEKFPFMFRKLHERIKILTIGRFVEKKGTLFLLEAINRLKEHDNNFTLTIIGDGIVKNKNSKVIKAKIIDYIKSNSLEGHVKLLPYISHENVHSVLMDHDMFILPSITAKNGDKEGIPNVLKEAMASGIPVISTYHAGIPELVKDTKTGFLFKENDVNGLLRKIKYVIKNHSKLYNLCLSARKKVEEEFNLAISNDELENIYSVYINDKISK